MDYATCVMPPALHTVTHCMQKVTVLCPVQEGQPCGGERLLLMFDRWRKLMKAFYNEKKKQFDISKVLSCCTPRCQHNHVYAALTLKSVPTPSGYLQQHPIIRGAVSATGTGHL